MMVSMYWIGGIIGQVRVRGHHPSPLSPTLYLSSPCTLSCKFFFDICILPPLNFDDLKYCVIGIEPMLLELFPSLANLLPWLYFRYLVILSWGDPNLHIKGVCLSLFHTTVFVFPWQSTFIVRPWSLVSLLPLFSSLSLSLSNCFLYCHRSIWDMWLGHLF